MPIILSKNSIHKLIFLKLNKIDVKYVSLHPSLLRFHIRSDIRTVKNRLLIKHNQNDSIKIITKNIFFLVLKALMHKICDSPFCKSFHTYEDES